ncbi:MAG: hypothetical protein AAFY71_09065 [Bacteroidota bacterium]
MKGIYCILSFVCLLSFTAVKGQVAIEPTPGIGARMVGMGNAYVAVRGDIWQAFLNPAGLPGARSLEVGTYVEQRFFLRELTNGSAGLVYPLATNQAVGVAISSRGFAGYRQNMAGFSYGITLLKKLSLGARLNLANLSVPNYGSAASIFADFGVQYQFNRQITLGASLYNVNQAAISNLTGERLLLPTILSAGISYRPSSELIIVADVVKQVDFPASFRGGVEYEINELIFARIGVATEPLMLNLGAGIKWHSLKVDFAMSYTELLGYTPHFSLQYAIGNKAEDLD